MGKSHSMWRQYIVLTTYLCNNVRPEQSDFKS